MTHGSNQPAPIDKGDHREDDLPQRGPPLPSDDDRHISGGLSEEASTPTSFASAEMVATPISMGGIRPCDRNIRTLNTKVLNPKADDTPQPLTLNDRALSIEPVSSIIGTRLKDGEVVQFGDYQLLEEIGRGGMGAIFRARQISLNRIVAVKVILQGQFTTMNDVRRFHAEAESAAVLRHEGIVPIYASGEYEGNPYFSMQFIEGNTLANLIASKAMNDRTAARLLSSIADAVAYAHSKGIIHRDLKPSNILINKHGAPIITDFGLAKRTDTDPNLTGTGQIIGTPNYMSPEQASGLNHLISTRSDIYSLGAILYAMCAGKPPFDAGTIIETLKQVTTELPAPMQRAKHRVDRDLETIAFKCLDKNPSCRYQSASELKEDLHRYLDHEPIKASATSLATRTSRWFRRNPALALLSSIIASMVIALAIGGPIIAYRQSKLQKSTRESLEKQNKLAQELRGTTASINANLIKIYAERGDAAVNAGNLLEALPSYTAALRGSIEAGQREWGHRFRVGSILQHAAVPIAMWEMPSQPVVAAISRNKEYLACATRNGDLCIWNITTKKQLYTQTSERRVVSANLQFFANDEKLLHTTGSTLRVLDLATPATPLLDIQMEAMIRAAVVDEDNKLCLVGKRNGTVTLLDINSGEVIHRAEKHQDTVKSVAISRRAGRFISACERGTTKLFDLETGHVIHTANQNAAVNHVEFSPDGKKYLAASDDNTLLILDSETGQPYSKAIRCSSNIKAAKFSHASSEVATGTSDCLVQIWDVETSKLLIPAMKHENAILSLEFKHDDTLLTSSSTDHSTGVWDTVTGDAICPPMPHSYIVENSFFLPGHCVLTTCGDRMVRKWQLLTKPRSAKKTTTDVISNTFTMSSNGSLLITGGTDGLVRITNTEIRNQRPSMIEHGVEIKCLAVSVDQNLLAVGDANSSTTIYHIGGPETQLTAGNAPPPVAKHVPVRMRDESKTALLSLQFSPDGTKLLVVHDSNAAFVFDSQEGELLYTLRHSRALLNAAFSTDGAQLLSSSRDGTAMLWNAKTGASTGIEAVHTDYVDAFAISPNNHLIATGSRDHTARILNAKTGETVGPPLQHHGGIVSIAFAPNGESIATGCRDGFARIWHLDQLDSPVTMRVGLGRTFVQYTPDGKILLTANEKQIRLLDTADGKSLGTILQHHAPVAQFAVGPNADSVISRDEDGKITTWSLPHLDMSPIHELEDKVELVTGYRADFRKGLEILTPRELSELIKQSASTP
ncbi:MAG TPA: hypothetical protein DEF45_10280 [Rhodopirellula sp.]|nr:hypothetical protein [Rhodopirellula sp.]